MPQVAVPIEVPPYQLSGVVYATLLNHRSAWQELGEAVNHPPYHAPPKAPVLYVKPRNTLAASGDPVPVPAGVIELELEASLGLVIGRPACRLEEASALEFIAGYLIVNDVSVPHRPYYRPRSAPGHATGSARSDRGSCPARQSPIPTTWPS